MPIPLDMFEDWLLNKNLARRTVKEYLYYLSKFDPFYIFDQEGVARFLSEPSNRNPSARSFMVNLKKFLMVNYKQLGLTTDQRLDVAEVEFPELTGTKEIKLVHPMTEAEIFQIEPHLPGERERLQLLLTYYGALRAGELLRIQICSFNWEDWKKDTTQYGECRVLGKGSRQGLALFPPEIMKRVARFIRSQKFASISSYLFLGGVESLEKIDIVNRLPHWERTLKKAAIAAGVVKFTTDKKIIPETDVFPHRLRHSRGHHLLHVLKLDSRLVQEILRHASITSTQRYTYTDKTHLKEALLKTSETSQASQS